MPPPCSARGWPYEWAVQAFATFDPVQNPGTAVLTTETGNHKVNVIFRFIREIPDAA